MRYLMSARGRDSSNVSLFGHLNDVSMKASMDGTLEGTGTVLTRGEWSYNTFTRKIKRRSRGVEVQFEACAGRTGNPFVKAQFQWNVCDARFVYDIHFGSFKRNISADSGFGVALSIYRIVTRHTQWATLKHCFN